MHQSTAGSWRTVNCGKGNHRRRKNCGDSVSWGFGKYPLHSFVRRGVILKAKTSYMDNAYGFFLIYFHEL